MVNKLLLLKYIFLKYEIYIFLLIKILYQLLIKILC